MTGKTGTLATCRLSSAREAMPGRDHPPRLNRPAGAVITAMSRPHSLVGVFTQKGWDYETLAPEPQVVSLLDSLSVGRRCPARQFPIASGPQASSRMAKFLA